jgi:hypothetical protein
MVEFKKKTWKNISVIYSKAWGGPPYEINIEPWDPEW